MEPRPLVISRRNLRRAAAYRRGPRSRRLLFWFSLLVVLGSVTGAGAFAAETPRGADVQTRVADLAGRLAVRPLVPGEVPDKLLDALVVTQDPRFMEHHGVDVVDRSADVGYDLQHRCPCRLGSTITERLVTLAYEPGGGELASRAETALVALGVERTIGKRQILADYASVIRLGDGLYGMESAARALYAGPLDALDLGQIATIAGMAAAGGVETADPRRNRAWATQSRASVLAALLSGGYVTSSQASAAAAEPLLPPIVTRGRT